eukprot:GFYU01010670.1.p2 GENE.GFYU01010670.1~~GFYU01010670.1.p2  ORF type:complete len:136 (+),score=62.95 GFYU01010670.1:31-438(+)
MGGCASKKIELSEELEKKIVDLFNEMDDDESNTLEKSEAYKFWGKNFPKVNAEAMFDEVDEDGDESVTLEEWKEFWIKVKESGYSDEELLDEIDGILAGDSWTGFKLKQNKKQVTPPHSPGGGARRRSSTKNKNK